MSPALLYTLLFVLFWALEIIATKFTLLAGTSVPAMILQTSFFALLFLLVWVLPSEGRKLRELLATDRRTFWRIVIANSCHYTLGTILYCTGISLTTATNAGFLFGLGPIFSTLFARILLHELIPTKRILALSLLLIGAYTLSTEFRTLIPQPGDILIILAVVAWTLGNVLMRRAIRDTKISGDIVSLLKPAAGLPVFLFIALLSRVFSIEPVSALSGPIFQPEMLGYTLVCGVLSALIWIFLYRALKLQEAAYVSILGMATPVLVLLLANIVLGEVGTPLKISGGTMIVVAGIFTHWQTLQQQRSLARS